MDACTNSCRDAFASCSSIQYDQPINVGLDGLSSCGQFCGAKEDPCTNQCPRMYLDFLQCVFAQDSCVVEGDPCRTEYRRWSSCADAALETCTEN
ncbi:MAG: hypothetical protein KC416_13265 [Myxococcales bacterium]|nr:hypothetical protein [Myxococcales bacterium]